MNQDMLENFKKQKELVSLYSEFVSQPKAEFFKSLGLGAVQGERHGIYLATLAGIRKKDPPIKMIDCRTSGGVFNLGHRHPKILSALKEAIDLGLDIGDHHMLSEQRALLAKKMASILPPGISKTQFCVGGGEAIDLALKLSRAVTKRPKIISAVGGYHGVTGLALATGDPRFKEIFNWNLPGFSQIPFGNIEAFRKHADEKTAAVIFESIPATAGILIPPKGFFAEVREICDDKGIIMIADEVQTGLGRTGQLWAIYGGLYPEEKVVPDIMVLAKGMSSGIYPLATCSYKPFIEEVFSKDPFLHISTTGGAEIGCYIAQKMLDIITADSFLENVRTRGKQFKQGMLEIKTNHLELVKEIRGRGLMYGIELPNERYGAGYTLAMIKNGIFADYCGNNEKTVKIMPPLIVNQAEIDEIVGRLAIAMESLPKIK
jgi:acetylornithine/succinyldiaminopimelate/putrescine aminotransferase